MLLYHWFTVFLFRKQGMPSQHPQYCISALKTNILLTYLLYVIDYSQLPLQTQPFVFAKNEGTK